MNYKKNLLSLRAADPNNFKALEFLIKMLGLKSNSWQSWSNNLGDEIKIFDDGQKLIYSFNFKDLNDLLQYSSLYNVIKISSIIIGIKKKNIIKLYLMSKDGFIRLFEYDKSWEIKHLFTETPAMILHILNMFLGEKDYIPQYFQIDDYIILTSPFDDFPADNTSFSIVWKELGV